MALMIKLYDKTMTAYTDITHDCDDGFPITQVVDDTLDYGVLIYTNTTEEPIEPFTRIDFIWDATHTDKMFIAEDSVVPRTKAVLDKKHTAVLVELTKILEKFIIQNMELSNLNDTLYEQVIKAVGNAVPKIATASTPLGYSPYNFILDSSLITLLNVNSEDFNADFSTLRELLDEMFSAVKCRVEVIDYAYNASTMQFDITLAAVNFNETTVAIAPSYTFKEQSNSVDDYCGAICSNVSNGISNNIIVHEDTVKSLNYTIDSNNKKLLFPYGIYKLHKFEFSTTSGITGAIGITYHDTATGTDPTVFVDVGYGFWIDATNYFVDKEYWDTLNEDIPADKSPAQRNTIYYERGKSNVDVSQTYKEIIFTESIMENLIVSAATRYFTDNYVEILTSLGYSNIGALIEAGGAGINPNYDEAIFRTQYYPYIDTMVTIPKLQSNYYDSKLAVIENQNAKVPDLNRLGDSLFFSLLRKGNNELYYEETIKGTPSSAYLNIKPLFAKIGTYIIYKREFGVYNNFIQVRYSLAENYGNLYSRANIAREKRIYPIPLEGTRTIIDIPTRIYATTGEVPTHESFYTSSALITFVYNLASTEGTTKAHWMSIVSSAKPTTTFLFSTNAMSTGNVMSFEGKFFDIFGAGPSITPKTSIFNWLGGKKVAFNPYVDSNGESESFECRLHSVVDFGSGSTYITNVKKLPEASIVSSIPVSAAVKAIRHKDRAEAITCKISTAIMGKDNNIIFGNEFATNNDLIGQSKPLYLYYSTSQVYSIDEKMCKGVAFSLEGDTSNYFDVTAQTGYSTLSLISIMQSFFDYVDITSWAIGDEFGKLYMGVNGKEYSINIYDEIIHGEVLE